MKISFKKVLNKIYFILAVIGLIISGAIFIGIIIIYILANMRW